MCLISYHSKVLKYQGIKKIVKPLGMFLLIVIFHVSTFAQRTISLRDYQRLSDIYNKAENKEGLYDGEDITYIKDVNNELDKFVGRWSANINDKQYLLDIVKKVNYKNKPTAKISRDFLMVWITVKSANGEILFTNTDEAASSNYFRGTNFQANTNIYMLDFYGICDKDVGQVNFYVVPGGGLSATYTRIDDIFAKGDCESVLPPKILLTKVLSED